jgi:hypothetical protein
MNRVFNVIKVLFQWQHEGAFRERYDACFAGFQINKANLRKVMGSCFFPSPINLAEIKTIIVKLGRVSPRDQAFFEVRLVIPQSQL